MKRILFLTVLLLVGAVQSASAALDLTGVSVDTSPVFSVAVIVITAIAGIWGIKKVIKLLNRS